MLSSSLKSAQEALDSFSAYVSLCQEQVERGDHNSALVALSAIMRGAKVNSDFYLNERIKRERKNRAEV